MNRIKLDQRLVAPVRIAAMGIWQAVDSGPVRVSPTLQQMRPLRGGPTARGGALQLA